MASNFKLLFAGAASSFVVGAASSASATVDFETLTELIPATEFQANFNTLGLSNPATYSVPGVAVQYVGTLGFPAIPIQGNFPAYGSTGLEAPDWRPFRATGYTLITPDFSAPVITFSLGNADTDLPTADLFAHVEVLGIGGGILGDFVSGPLGFAGTLGGYTNGYSNFEVRVEGGSPDIAAIRINVSTLEGGGFNPTASDWTVLDNVFVDHSPLCLDPCHAPVPAGGSVPEPSTWALLIVGFGGLGALLRRRRIVVI